MKELVPQIIEWARLKKPFAVARVIQTWGSSPRPVGSALIISSDGEMTGSVSGGCVEGSVVKEARKIIRDQNSKRLSYGVSDDEAWAVGLTCGGRVQVYLQAYPLENSPQADVWNSIQLLLAENKSCILVSTLIDGENLDTLIDSNGNLIGFSLPDDVVKKAKEACVHRKHELLSLNDVDYFIHVFPKRSRLLIIGAAHIAVALVQLAKLYDFETWVIDPRAAFANSTQFIPQPDQLFEKYPSEVLNDLALDENTYSVILSHDPKIDDNALHILLRSNVAYIGALGSRKTHEKRVDRMKQAGFSTEEINRIESPVGIDIHAQGAREIALSIMGSLIREREFISIGVSFLRKSGFTLLVGLPLL